MVKEAEQARSSQVLSSNKRQRNHNGHESEVSRLERRSKAACIRCKKRKTKCSGTYPCRTCAASGDKCEYSRKPKKITVLDTEIESYQEKIEELTRELKAIKKKPEREGALSSILTKNYRPTEHLSLSIWLGSASCELVCRNLKQFTKTDVVSFKDLVVSPDFDLFLEEKAYDDLLVRKTAEFSVHSEDFMKQLSTLNIERLGKLLDNVVLFINSGYLIIDPLEFKNRVENYFNQDGNFQTDVIQADKVDVFALKIMMVLALGHVYSEDSCIGKQNKSFKSVPGSKYFSIVVQYLSDVFTLINPLPNISESLEVIELFGLISLYLRIMDKKNLAVLFTLNALQLCISLNLHKSSNHYQGPINNQAHVSKVFWTTYCLNRFYTSRIGQPLLLDVEEITTEYPEAYNYSLSDDSSIPKTIYEYGNSKTMKFYIDLAMISDRICKELYSSKNKFDNQEYLNSMFSILESLTEWTNRIPSYLRIKLASGEPFDANIRLIYTLNLNYLHHIYLTCIPVLLHFSKIKLQSIRKSIGSYNSLKLKELPKNISNLIVSCIISSQETIKIFIALHKERLIRSFGFVDLDYLFSSSLILTICMILKIQLPDNEDLYSFEEYLEAAINLMNEMSLMGNRIAKAKLNQILDLLSSLHTCFVYYGYENFMSGLSMFGGSKAPETVEEDEVENPKEQTPAQFGNEIPQAVKFFFGESQADDPLTSLFNLNSNTILDEFDIGRDIINIDNMDPSSFFPAGSDELYLLTEQDMLFVDNVMQTIPSDD